MAKRFYKDVAVTTKDKAIIVTLDGYVLKSPGKQDLIFTRKAHAECVAAEWEAQKKDIKPETMPCTRLLNVACELTPSRRPDLIAEFSAYLGTDLLCHRAHEPQDLAQLQEKHWQPLLDWAAEKHALHLCTVTGIRAAQQPKATLKRAADYARNCDNMALTLLLHFTACYGSSVLALSVLEGRLDALEAYEISRLDEVFQNSRWGEDPLTRERVDNMKAELSALAVLIGE